MVQPPVPVPDNSRRVALLTGGSRGIGAATALMLAQHNYDVALTYRNKAARAREVVEAIVQQGQRGLALACDMTNADDVQRGVQQVSTWSTHLDALILNASGGMERDLLAVDPDYPIHINRDAQLHFVDAVLPLLVHGSTITLVTSHWAHLYGQMQQLPAYEPVAASKYAGEQALRARQDELAALGIRLLVVTGDLIEGTITPKLLERTAPGLLEQRRTKEGTLPTATEMGQQVALATLNPSLPTGSLVVVGAPLTSMLS
jgi:NAD(P)-dependent dehydrogenase (short-subunit alcohol dehydrogenase family)